MLKLSDEELPVLASALGLSGSNMTIVKALMKQYDLRLIALTQGEKGAILVSSDQVSECQGIRVEVGYCQRRRCIHSSNDYRTVRRS